MKELRQVVRTLLRVPAFTGVAVLALALGIGATTAIFAVLNAVVLNPLPYRGAGSLVSIGHAVPAQNPEQLWDLSPSGYFEFRQNSHTLTDVGVYRSWDVTVTGGAAGAERARVASVSDGLLPVLGARPALGRLLLAEDDRPGAEAVAVLSHEFWARRFASDARVVGQTVVVDGNPVQIVGVLEPGVRLPDGGDAPSDVWMAERLDPAAEPQNWHAFNAVARLRPGATPQEAERELNTLTSRFPERFPSAYPRSFMEETGFRTRVQPLRDAVVGDVGRTLWILLGAVSLVLLVACADVANLFLVRMEGRRREIAIRAAVGASGGRLVRQLVLEGVVVALAAWVLALGLAFAGVRMLVAAAPEELPRIDEVRVGGTAVLFALLLALVVGALVGWLSMPRYGVGDWAAGLRDSTRGSTTGRGAKRAQSVLVVAQVAIALVLLGGAGFMLRTYQRLRAVEPGFDASGVLAVDLTLPEQRYTTRAAAAAFYHELADRVDALPGVQGVGLAEALPLSGRLPCRGVFIEDRPAEEQNEAPCVTALVATPGFLSTLRIPVRGNESGWSEVEQRQGGVIVTPALAAKLWPGQNPIGKGIRGMKGEPPYYRVVGVTGDVRADGLDLPESAIAVFPALPMMEAPLWNSPRSMTMAVRVSGGRPEAFAPLVRRVLTDLDSSVPLTEVRTMESVVAGSIARTSFTMFLLQIAAAVALLLGAVGLYGVVSYAVRERRNEIAIRMALGARAGQVAAMVLKHSMALVLGGVALGIIGSLAANRVLRTLLSEAAPAELPILLAAALLLVSVAMAASWVPMWRAVRVDPSTELRSH